MSGQQVLANLVRIMNNKDKVAKTYDEKYTILIHRKKLQHM